MCGPTHATTHKTTPQLDEKHTRGKIVISHVRFNNPGTGCHNLPTLKEFRPEFQNNQVTTPSVFFVTLWGCFVCCGMCWATHTPAHSLSLSILSLSLSLSLSPFPFSPYVRTNPKTPQTLADRGNQVHHQAREAERSLVVPFSGKKTTIFTSFRSGPNCVLFMQV